MCPSILREDPPKPTTIAMTAAPALDSFLAKALKASERQAGESAAPAVALSTKEADDRAQATVSQTARLDTWLGAQWLCRVPVAGGGHCQFRAFA